MCKTVVTGSAAGESRRALRPLHIMSLSLSFVFGAHFFSFPLHKKGPPRVFLALTNGFVNVLRS